MKRLHYIFVLISATQTVAEFYNDGLQNEVYTMEGEPFRNSRKPQNAGRNNIGQGVRFGWQNPILVAPTLPPASGWRPIQQSSWGRPWNPINVPPKQPPPYIPDPTFPATTQRYVPQPPPTHYPNNPAYATTRREFIPQFTTTPTQYYPDPTYPSTVPPRNDYNPQQRGPWATTRRPRPTSETDFERLPDSEAQTEQRCPSGSRKGKRNGKCYALGSTEPCHENMAFYADPSSKEFGHCDCIQNLNRPLVYHPNSDKCYFIFQQAYCQPEEWLVLDPESGVPSCDINRCIDWTQSRSSNWNWTSNGPQLDYSGTVALLRERSCARLGWPCKQEGREQLRPLLEENSTSTQPRRPLIRLTFSGLNLICERDNEMSEFQIVSENKLEIDCKPGLINKWRLDGNCN